VKLGGLTVGVEGEVERLNDARCRAVFEGLGAGRTGGGLATSPGVTHPTRETCAMERVAAWASRYVGEIDELIDANRATWETSHDCSSIIVIIMIKRLLIKQIKEF